MERRPIAPVLATLALIIPPIANLGRQVVHDLRGSARPGLEIPPPGPDEEPRELARFRPTAARWFTYQDFSPLRSSGWIDRGSESGVRQGQAVATARCELVGRVWKVYPLFSLVQALDDPAFRVRAAARLASGPDAGTAPLETAEVEAVVRGDGQGGRLVAEHIVGALRLPAQILLRTSGAGGRFPAGLAVGYASEGGGPLGGQALRAAASIDRPQTVYVLADPFLEAVRAAGAGDSS